MSLNKTPLFGKKSKQDKLSEDEDDCIYLGEELNTEATKMEHVSIKKEDSDKKEDSWIEVVQLYSQEQDSIVDEEYHNSFSETEPCNQVVEEDDDDEDIKLIYDSRDLIEQICRKYDQQETQQEQVSQIEHSPIVVKQKSVPHQAQDSDDDMDVLLCSVGDEYEKKNTPRPKQEPLVTKQGLQVTDNFQNLKQSLFGDDLDSLSPDEDQQNVQNENFKSVLSSRTPVRPSLVLSNPNSSAKRTISDQSKEASKKQKLNSDESLFHVERPPIDLKKSHVRKPLFPSTGKKSNITSKKSIELLLNKKRKPNTHANTNPTTSLTQCMAQARYENKMREKARSEILCQNNMSNTGANNTTVQCQQEKETTRKISNTKSNDVVGSILNQMNVQHDKKNGQTKPTCLFVFENILSRILKWSYNWLEEQSKFCSQKKQAESPPVVDEHELGPLIDSYLSYEDYYKTMFPMLLCETWEEIFNEWREAKRHEPRTYQNSPICLKSLDKVTKHPELMVLRFQILVDSGQKGAPCQDDLLRVSLKIKDNEACKQTNYFGIVRGIKRLKTEDPMVSNAIKELIKKEEMSNRSSKNLSVHDFYVYVRYRYYVTAVGNMVDYEIITSLSSSFRRVKALIDFQNSPLAKTILNVSQLDPTFWIKQPEKDIKLNLSEFNESQQKVIVQCSSMVRASEPKLCFIQGPPGTGKSHTIIGIINALFTRLHHLNRILAKQSSTNKKDISLKILICSPSNGGCDELTRRIKSLKNKLDSALSEKEMKREARVVRVGRTECINKDCEEMTIDFLVKKTLEQLMIEKKTNKSESLLSHYKTLQFYEKKCTIKVKEFRTSGKVRELKEAENELEEIKNKIKKFEDQLAKNRSNHISFGERKKLELEAKEKILKQADIIISTLNFCGNSLLDCLTSEKNNGHSPISMIIIDEAAQCLEVDSLIPLRFGCDKIVQVGDPEQLPATVLSRRAQDKGFAMSLFERVYQRFKYMDKSPIRMLYVQYRMHPDICDFPSRNFYKNKLKTQKEIAQKRSIFGLKPYLFYNVLNSQEIGDEVSGSMYNPNEGEHIVDFCKYLSDQYDKYGIGVITPYQSQVKFLRDLLEKNNLKTKIEVGTVDSFQGRQKDIVIFSCVRARNTTGSIGFLAHRQRLNVALTRAKFALYIFGHVDSLVVNADWYNCIQDARKKCQILNLE